MHDQIKKMIDSLSDEMIEGIKAIVKIKSVEDTPSFGKPFGEGINEALEETLKLAKNMGFETENVDGYAGIVKYGSGDNYIGIFGHLDVVKEEDGWDYPPYSAYENADGRIFSRGILDNKGPILSNLYGLYALKKLNIQPKYPIWIIFGTNEETGFKDMAYYLKKKRPPIKGWTPDCKWPVVYAERGRGKYQLTAHTNYKKQFIDFVNEYLIDKDTSLQKLGLAIKDEEFGTMQLRNVQLIESENYSIEFVLSYPASITNQEIMARLNKKVPKGISLNCISNWQPVFFDKQSEFCKTLQHVYEEVTGLDGTPVTTTGGTYAKVIPNILPFGPSFPGQRDIGHLPNEWMDRKDIIINAKIYALSMYELIK